jgi:hypothetical protein
MIFYFNFKKSAAAIAVAKQQNQMQQRPIQQY